MKKYLEWHEKRKTTILIFISYYAIWSFIFTTTFFKTPNLDIRDKILFGITVPLTGAIITIDLLIVGIGYLFLSIKEKRQEKIEFKEICRYGYPHIKIEKINKNHFKVKKGTYWSKNIKIADKETFEIEAGTTILFLDYARIECKGNLFIHGTEIEPVILKAYNEERGWKGIYAHKHNSLHFYNTIIKNIIITNEDKQKAPIEINQINYYAYPIIFLNCEFKNNINKKEKENTAGAIFAEIVNKIEIENCLFNNNETKEAGIICIRALKGMHTTIKIYKCIIDRNISKKETKGIDIKGGSVELKETLIINNTSRSKKKNIGVNIIASIIYYKNNIIINNLNLIGEKEENIIKDRRDIKEDDIERIMLENTNIENSLRESYWKKIY